MFYICTIVMTFTVLQSVNKDTIYIFNRSIKLNMRFLTKTSKLSTLLTIFQYFSISVYDDKRLPLSHYN